MRWGWICGLAMTVGFSGTAQASEIPPAYHVAAASQGVPAEVLYAVAMTESKMSLARPFVPGPGRSMWAAKAIAMTVGMKPVRHYAASCRTPA
ncbi:hypothetical protein A8U91_03958 [Halomonas elongata]|uniref:Transglycosylase SLT domain-containing protein n=1 Tax=Halomonas elongata TaxID=2746 RepID=A0A1B8NY39_HALEL|nr:hypothetical protein A8U91_03958 [Halomonas elongata]